MEMMGMMGGESSDFSQLISGTDGSAVSSAITDNYDVLYGKMPENYDEVVLVLDKNNEISASTLYELGILPTDEYKELMQKIDNGEKVNFEMQKLNYADICSRDYWIIPQCDLYVKNNNNTYDNISEDNSKIENLLDGAMKLKIVGVIKPNADTDVDLIDTAIGYTQALTDYLINYTNNSNVVKAQLDNSNINVLNGLRFAPDDDSSKIADAKTYLENLGVTEKAELCRTILGSETVQSDDSQMATQMAAMDETSLAAQLDEFLQDPDDDVLLMIYDTYVSSGNYEDNLSAMGVVSLDAPSSIDIYADNFEDKDSIADCITTYNKTANEADQITYTDYVGLLMSSVTTIVNVISYVLIAFVAVSLIVSSIMIGIITYISVLERTKEIGILRAIGASKKNISQVFNAETLIIGLCSGLIGIFITLVALIPGNAIIHSLTGSDNVNASLPIISAIILVVLSVALTLIGGVIPSRKAAKKDPVTALRTE